MTNTTCQWEMRIQYSVWKYICGKITMDNGFRHFRRSTGFSGFLTACHFKAKPSVAILNSDPEEPLGSNFVLKMVLLRNPETSTAHIHTTVATRRKFFHVHVTVHRNKFLFNKTNRRTNFTNLLCQEILRISGRSSAHHQEFSTVHSALVYDIQVWWQL
jgi:hypothetical protein